jgi:hypothetical protein
LKKGSKAAKAWGAKMRRLRGTKKKTKRKTTTRKRRTTRKGMLTLKRTKAYKKKLARVRKRVFSRRAKADNWSF